MDVLRVRSDCTSGSDEGTGHDEEASGGLTRSGGGSGTGGSGGSLRERIGEVHDRIQMSACRSGRRAEDVTLVAVTKTVLPERIAEAFEAGIRVFGENRVQEAEEKIARLDLPVAWHLVGHLQSNKASTAAALFDVIHSLDTPELAQRLDRASQLRPSPLDVLVQVNVSGESAKKGLRPAQLREALERIAPCSRLRVVGLMTIPPLDRDPEKARPHFSRLRALAEQAVSWGIPRVQMRHLSMGMTDDYQVAIEEGATIVRIGQAIFGERMPVHRPAGGDAGGPGERRWS